MISRTGCLLIVAMALSASQPALAQNVSPDLAFPEEWVSYLDAPYDVREYFLLLPLEALSEPASSEERPYWRVHLLSRPNLLDDLSLAWDPFWDIQWMIDTLSVRDGFLSFHSKGDGGGTRVQVTYFNRENQVPLVAVGVTDWSMCCESTTLTVYTFDGERWADVTGSVMPELKLADFLEPGTDRSLIPQACNENPPLSIELPLEGKNILARLDVDTMYDGYAEGCPTTEAFLSFIESSVNPGPLMLTWDDGIFVKE